MTTVPRMDPCPTLPPLLSFCLFVCLFFLLLSLRLLVLSLAVRFRGRWGAEPAGRISVWMNVNVTSSRFRVGPTMQTCSKPPSKLLLFLFVFILDLSIVVL